MAAATINARHRKHYKSGSCLEQHPLERPLVISKKFKRLLDLLSEEGRRNASERRIRKILAEARAERVEAAQQPRPTQSLFGRMLSRLFGKAA